MLFKILTIFPEMFKGPFQASMLKRAQEKEFIKIEIIDIRDYSNDKHHKVDDYPYGGGSGMVMKPEPLYSCLSAHRKEKASHVLLLTPQGKTFSQKIAQNLAQEEEIILICGHYEGVDERVRDLVDEEVSLGDFILTGGEIAAMALTDCVARLVEGVLGDQESLREESFTWGLLEYPQFTRPRSFLGKNVPEVLVSGNHQAVANWRYKQSICRTFFRRPDLFSCLEWGDKEREAVDEFFTGEATGEKVLL